MKIIKQKYACCVVDYTVADDTLVLAGYIATPKVKVACIKWYFPDLRLSIISHYLMFHYLVLWMFTTYLLIKHVTLSMYLLNTTDLII